MDHYQRNGRRKPIDFSELSDSVLKMMEDLVFVKKDECSMSLSFKKMEEPHASLSNFEELKKLVGHK